MKRTQHYIVPILKTLSLIDFEDIARAIYAGNRPSAGKEKDEFLVIRTGSRVGDHGVWQQMALYVEIYVRNLQNGLPNLNRLQALEDKVIEQFPIVHCESDESIVWRWRATNPTLQISGDDNLGFSVWLVRASLQVNTTDRFALPDE